MFLVFIVLPLAFSEKKKKRELEYAWEYKAEKKKYLWR